MTQFVCLQLQYFSSFLTQFFVTTRFLFLVDIYMGFQIQFLHRDKLKIARYFL